MALLLVVVLMIRDASTLQVELYAKLESRFGFTSEIIALNPDDNSTSTVVIHPVENGRLYKAGFREGDTLSSYSKFKFYRLLHENKGSSIPVNVLSKQGTDKTIILHIPD